MLVLNRRVGEPLHIGDDVCVTAYGKLRYHVTMGVIAPTNAQVFYGEMRMRPAILPDGERFYLISLLTTETFRIDDIELRVSFTPSYLGAGSTRNRQGGRLAGGGAEIGARAARGNLSAASRSRRQTPPGDVVRDLAAPGESGGIVRSRRRLIRNSRGPGPRSDPHPGE